MFVLVGNKLDLESEREVDAKEAEAFAKEKKFLFFEVSAKTGENVREMFQNYIYPRMAEKFRIFGDEYEGPVQQGDSKQNEAGIKLDDEGEKKKKKRQIGASSHRLYALGGDERAQKEKDVKGKGGRRGIEKRRIDEFFQIEQRQRRRKKKVERVQRVYDEYSFTQPVFQPFEQGFFAH